MILVLHNHHLLTFINESKFQDYPLFVISIELNFHFYYLLHSNLHLFFYLKIVNPKFKMNWQSWMNNSLNDFMIFIHSINLIPIASNSLLKQINKLEKFKDLIKCEYSHCL